jgi:hypothetical protein
MLPSKTKEKTFQQNHPGHHFHALEIVFKKTPSIHSSSSPRQQFAESWHSSSARSEASRCFSACTSKTQESKKTRRVTTVHTNQTAFGNEQANCVSGIPGCTSISGCTLFFSSST